MSEKPKIRFMSVLLELALCSKGPPTSRPGLTTAECVRITAAATSAAVASRAVVVGGAMACVFAICCR